MDKSTRDKLAAAFGIPQDIQEVLDVGSSHSGQCRCETCRKWWRSMGPDGSTYGPFERHEIEDGTAAAFASPMKPTEIANRRPSRLEME